jgi:hypothetical protein
MSRVARFTALLLVATAPQRVSAFTVQWPAASTTKFHSSVILLRSTTPDQQDQPQLPELKGDFNWDEAYANDDDWITTNVPGKIVLNDAELAQQVAALNALEAKWRKTADVDAPSEKAGWVPDAELLNGRTAMFFLVTGLLTEYWTGYSMPAQVEEMLRVGGFIGFD